MTNPEPDDLEALKTIVEALKPFKPDDQDRILRWTREKFGLAVAPTIETSRLSPEKFTGTPTATVPQGQGARASTYCWMGVNSRTAKVVGMSRSWDS